MKKVIIVIAVLILLVISGAAIFIATFNADKYRPFVVQKIEQAIGKKVSLGHLSLVWKNGIALEVKDLKIYDPLIQEQPLAELKSATAVVRLMPLLNKDVQIASIILTGPRVEVEYGPEGALAVAGIKPPASSGAPSASAGSSSSRAPLSIDLIQITDGEVYFNGSKGPTKVNLNIKDLDLRIKHFSFTKPLAFDLQMAVLSDRQNVSLSGEFLIPDGDRAGSLRNFTLKTDLGLLNVAEMLETFSQLKEAGLQEPLAGELQVNVEQLNLEPQSIGSADAEIRLNEGKISLSKFKTPVEHIKAQVSYRQHVLEIKELSAEFAGGNLRILGNVKNPLSDPRSDVQAAFHDLSLDALMPAAAQGLPALRGRLSLDMQAQAAGLSWPPISQTLSGKGHLTLNDGVLLNYNVLGVVVQKIAGIPLIGDTLLSNFPEQYRAKLNEPSTILKPIDLPFTAQNGTLNFPDMKLATELFGLHGSGSYQLSNMMNIRASLVIGQAFSQAMVKASAPVQLLADNQGQIEIPLVIQGPLPNIEVLPDIDYLTQKIATSKAQELVTDFIKDPDAAKDQLQNMFSGKPAAQNTSNAVPDSSANPAPQQAQSTESSFANLFQKAMKDDN